MAVLRKRRKMRRTQICLMDEEYEMAWRMAQRKGVTFGQAVRDSIRTTAAGLDDVERRRIESMMSIVGILEGADPEASVKHDEILYGPDASPHE